MARAIEIGPSTRCQRIVADWLSAGTENLGLLTRTIKTGLLTVFLACFGVSCMMQKKESARVASPDGKCVAVLTCKEKTGIPLPGPEPPRTEARWAQLTVLRDGEIVQNTGFEKAGVYSTKLQEFDLLWAPDSSRLAYRMINTVRIIDQDGTVSSFDIVKDNALVSSFRWISSKELLVVSKGIDEPLDMYGYPVHYHGYMAKSTYVKVSRIHLGAGVTERFKQDVNNPTFIFRSIGFENQEISPYSSRVAFSDGKNVNIYDDSKGIIIAKARVFGKVEGMWWQGNDTVILGIGLLSSSIRGFERFNVEDSTVKNVTGKLLPLWDGSYLDADWYKSKRE